MQTHEVYNLAGRMFWLLFMFAFGACAGSLINVLVYRLPRGMGVVTPPSKCPACETKLTWRENIPVLGWVLLGGRCRFCKSRISAEYPLVELFVGLLTAATFYLWYQAPADLTLLGIHLGSVRPEWALRDAWDAWPRETWPMFVVVVVLICSLVAMTIVDAKTFTIPLQIPWFVTVTGVLFHVGYAVYLSATGKNLGQSAPGWIWSLPTPGGNVVATDHAWWWIGASIGGFAGVVLATVLLETGLIRRSFADYAEWETKQLKAKFGEKYQEHVHGLSRDELKPTDARREAPRFFGPVMAFMTTTVGFAGVGWWIGSASGIPRWIGLLAGVLIAPIVAGRMLTRRNRSGADDLEEPKLGVQGSETSGLGPEMWIEYPHARREMLKELLFLTPSLALGWGGGELAARLWGVGHVPQLWLIVLAGVLLGYLIGGGVIWGVRILGSLAFGREAMGLGDVHMMAAVGVCTGWIDAALALPIAAVLGLYWAIASALASGRGGVKRAMPFGPYLAVATLVVIYAKPLIESGLTLLLNAGLDGRSINLP